MKAKLFACLGSSLIEVPEDELGVLHDLLRGIQRPFNIAENGNETKLRK